MNNQEVKVNFYDGDEESWQLTDDDGTVETFFGVATVDMGGESYILMQPETSSEGHVHDEHCDHEHDEESSEVVIFKREVQDDASDIFEPVMDEDLADKIFEEFLRASESEFKNAFLEDGEDLDIDMEKLEELINSDMTDEELEEAVKKLSEEKKAQKAQKEMVTSFVEIKE